MKESLSPIESFARVMRFPARGRHEPLNVFENSVKRRTQEWLIHRVMEYGMVLRQNTVVRYRPTHEGAGRKIQEPITEAELFYSAKVPDEIPL